ncbi:MAG TPA: secretin N-terminal domain-containing protein, partial [Verrucomicrobiae bacterium]
MKTSLFQRMPVCRAKIRLRIFLFTAALLGAAAQLMAQTRVTPHNLPTGIVLPNDGNPPPSAAEGSAPKNPVGEPWVPSEPLLTGASTNSADGIELSLQGANVDMVAEWLAQTTGKTVIKSPQVQCQLTIMSSKKVPVRQAINMIYRALAMEGFSAVELSDSILIVPQGKEPQMSPEVVSGSLTNIPPGRQLLVKVFQLKHIQAADVKVRIQTALSDKGAVDVDQSANQVIVTDYNDNLRVVGDLIDALDSEHPEDVAVRVIPLKHIAAGELAKEIEPLYEKMTGKAGNKTTVDVVGDDRSNSLIVFSDLTDFGAIEKLVAMMDTEDAQEKVTQTFTLKNADAQDVAKQLQDLNDTQNSSGSRYAIYYSSVPDTGSKKFSVVADRRRNAIIVQAPPSQMDSLAKMIAELDEPVADNGLAPEIIPLKYVSATDIEEVLNDLFVKKTQQRSYYDLIYDMDAGNDS